MQQLDAITLKALSRELRAALCGPDTAADSVGLEVNVSSSANGGGAKVSKVQHPSAREFILTFWGGPLRESQQNLLYIQLSPEAPFCLLIDTKQRQATVKQEFEKPTGLCMLLRKHLGGANLLDIHTLPGERVLNLVFENHNELGNRVRLVLSLELMGKHTNMIFYDAVSLDILAVAHGVSEQMSSHRELAAGLPYAPPPQPAHKRLIATLSATDLQALWQDPTERENLQSRHKARTTRDPLAALAHSSSQKPPETAIHTAVSTEVDNPAERTAAFLSRHVAGLGKQIATFLLETLPVATTGATLPPSVMPLDVERIIETLRALDAGTSVSPFLLKTGKGFGLLPASSHPEFETLRQRADSPLSGAVGFSGANVVNAMLSEFFLSHLQQSRMGQRRAQLDAILEAQLRKLQRRREELSPIAPEEIQRLQAIGDRLLGGYSSGELDEGQWRGKTLITLNDYETGDPWRIGIDPGLGWLENAQVYYRRAKKAKARKQAYDEHSTQLLENRDFLETLRQMVRQADTFAELDALAADLGHAGIAPKKVEKLSAKGKRSDGGRKKGVSGKGSGSKKSDGEGLQAGIVSLQSSDGFEILLGKSAQGNETIIGKLSRSEDIWLHVHQMPGSHVLIRATQLPVPETTLLEAATLAAHYSSARHSVNIPVIYTSCKYVRKIPQSYPGHVNYRQEKTVFITPDPALLQQFSGITHP